MSPCFWCGDTLNSEGICANCAHKDDTQDIDINEGNKMAGVGATVWVDGTHAATLREIKEFVDTALALGFDLDHKMDDTMFVIREATEVDKIQCGEHKKGDHFDVLIRSHDCT